MLEKRITQEECHEIVLSSVSLLVCFIYFHYNNYIFKMSQSGYFSKAIVTKYENLNIVS